MKLIEPGSGRHLQEVGVALTMAEAKELHDTLRMLLDDPQRGHEHVSSADFQIEMTVWIDLE